VPDILVIDDERALRDTLAYNLRRAGFDVRTAADGATGLAAARARRPDLILLDVLLPGGMDGFEVCRLLRQELRCPIVLISARAEEVDRVVGLEVGADDYVTKPFSVVELIARVKAHLRRAAIALPASANAAGPASRVPASPPLAVGPLSIDVSRRTVTAGGKTIHLKRREFELLHHLARHPGVTLTRAALLDALWPVEIDRSDTRAVDVCVHRLRERIEPDPARPTLIQTVRGLGYALRVPRAVPGAAAAAAAPRRPPLEAINVPLKTA